MKHTTDLQGWVAVLALSLCLALAREGAHGQAVVAPPDDFAAAMDAAMARMERDMMVPRTTDPDRDFAAMMIPHHQGAIDMARTQLRFGRDPALRRLAQGIIVEQQQEIAVMREALKALPPPARADVTPSRHESMEH